MSGRFTPYLLATPRTLPDELRALGLERHAFGRRFFQEQDVTRVCDAVWGAAPGSFPPPAPRG